MINYDNEREKERSEDSNSGSTPLSTEACSLIIHNSFEFSKERKKESSDDAKISSMPLNAERDAVSCR